MVNTNYQLTYFPCGRIFISSFSEPLGINIESLSSLLLGNQFSIEIWFGGLCSACLWCASVVQFGGSSFETLLRDPGRVLLPEHNSIFPKVSKFRTFTEIRRGRVHCPKPPGETGIWPLTTPLHCMLQYINRALQNGVFPLKFVCLALSKNCRNKFKNAI